MDAGALAGMSVGDMKRLCLLGSAFQLMGQGPSYGIGKPGNRRASQLADWLTGMLEDRLTGGPADRQTGVLRNTPSSCRG